MLMELPLNFRFSTQLLKISWTSQIEWPPLVLPARQTERMRWRLMSSFGADALLRVVFIAIGLFFFGGAFLSPRKKQGGEEQGEAKQIAP